MNAAMRTSTPVAGPLVRIMSGEVGVYVPSVGRRCEGERKRRQERRQRSEVRGAV